MLHRSFAYALISGAVLFSTSALASDINRDHALDQRGEEVMDARSNCVLTKWDSQTGSCGEKEAAPAPAPAAKPALKLGAEERTVYFDFNKSNIKPSEKAKLDSLIRTVNESKAVESVDIVGHTDPIGSVSYNEILSTKRAEAVKNYLASKGGIKTRNVRLDGVGASVPVAQCDKSMPRNERIACLAKDRRVEVQFNLKQ